MKLNVQVLPGMVERGRGTILFTGCSASMNGIAGFSELCKEAQKIKTQNCVVELKKLNLQRVFSFYCMIRFILIKPGCGKFALRGLSQCLAREFQPLGIHIAHVVIDGVVGPPRYVPFFPRCDSVAYFIQRIYNLLILLREFDSSVNK